MILEGAKIIMLGMITVFIMLGVLVVGTSIASRIILAIEGPPAAPGQTDDTRTPRREQKPLAAIITAAVAMFRRNK